MRNGHEILNNSRIALHLHAFRECRRSSRRQCVAVSVLNFLQISRMNPSTRALPIALSVAIFALITAHAHAARPLITDDARVVDAKSCQVESWVRREHSHTEVWALPGCNFAGDVEFTLGGQAREDGESPRQLVVQAKALLKPLESNGWGAALTLGHVRHSSINGGKNQRDFYVNAPLSKSFLDDKLVVHSNLGWLREGATLKNRTTWGLGTETQLNSRVYLIAEAFGQVSRESQYQVGLRFWVIPDRVQVDTTYGNRFGSAGSGGQARWFSIGLRLLTPAFLP